MTVEKNSIIPPVAPKSRIKKVLLRSVLVLLILFVLPLLLAYIFEDRIKNIVVSSINSKLKIEVGVKDIHFSFLKKFPYAVLQFDDLLAHPSLPYNKKDTLLYAKKFYLMFNLKDVFSNKYELKKVEVNDAVLNLMINQKGKSNFEIWKENTSSPGNNFNMNVNQVKFKNVAIIFNNELSKQHYDLLAESNILSGNFSSQHYDLNCAGDLMVYSFQIGKADYIRNKKTQLDLHLNIDKLHNAYTLRSSKLEIEGLDLTTEGLIKKEAQKTFVDLKLKSSKANIVSLLTALPNTIVDRLNEFDAKGELAFDAKINGYFSDNEIPLIQVNFSSGNSSLSPPNSSVHLDKIAFKAFYTNKKSASERTGFLSVKNFYGLLEGKPVRANFELTNFINPYINAQIEGSVNLKQVADFYKPDTLESITGEVKLNVSFNGNADNKLSYNSSGTAQLSNVGVKLKNSATTFTNFFGIFNLQGNELNVVELKGGINSSDIKLQGVITNAINYLLQPDQSLIIDADLKSNTIQLDDIILKENNVKVEAGGGLRFSKNLKCKLSVSVDQLSYQKFKANQIRGSITLQDGVLNTDALSFKTMDGNISLQGEIDASRGDSLLITYNANITDINVSSMFNEMSNFGQQVLTEKNIKGRVTASIQFASVWSRNLEVNPKSIYAKCNLTIQNGELINFQPMLSLSRFVKGSDLNDVKFATLTNQIEIKNQVINIPTMEIQSSALNLFASGTHTFDNVIDYKIKMQLSEILGKKVKDQNTEFGTIEEDGYGRPNLFLTMKGDLKNPKISYDKKAVEVHIQQNIKAEKQNMKVILNKEFGWFKKDTVVQKQKQQPDKKKKEELQIEIEPEEN